MPGRGRGCGCARTRRRRWRRPERSVGRAHDRRCRRRSRLEGRVGRARRHRLHRQLPERRPRPTPPADEAGCDADAERRDGDDGKSGEGHDRQRRGRRRRKPRHGRRRCRGRRRRRRRRRRRDRCDPVRERRRAHVHAREPRSGAADSPRDDADLDPLLRDRSRAIGREREQRGPPLSPWHEPLPPTPNLPAQSSSAGSKKRVSAYASAHTPSSTKCTSSTMRSSSASAAALDRVAPSDDRRVAAQSRRLGARVERQRDVSTARRRGLELEQGEVDEVHRVEDDASQLERLRALVLVLLVCRRDVVRVEHDAQLVDVRDAVSVRPGLPGSRRTCRSSPGCSGGP